MPIRRDNPVIFIKVGAPGGNEKQRVEVQSPATDTSGEQHFLSLTFTDEEKKTDKLELVVDNFFLTQIDSPIWKKGNKLEARWGYRGLLTPLRTFTIKKVTGSIKLKIEAEAEDIQLDRDEKTRVFENQKVSDVVRQLAKEAGFGQAAVQYIDDTTIVHEQISQVGETDYVFLKRLALKELWDFYIDFDGWHFHERRTEQKPLRRFIYYTDPGQGDIIGAPSFGDLAKAKPAKVVLRGRDPITKENFEVVGDSTTAASGWTALGQVMENPGPDDAAQAGDENAKENATAQVYETTAKTREEALRKAIALYRRVQLNAVPLEFTAVGDPRMIAKSTVLVENIGPTTSGLYFVKQVVHSIGGATYTIKLKCTSDGKAAFTSSAFDKLPGQGKGVAPKAKVNTVEPGDKPGTAASDKLTPEKVFNVITGKTEIRYRDGSGRLLKGD
jgi:phage protein D